VDLRNHDNVTALHNAVAFGHTVCVCVYVCVFVFACDCEVAAPTRGWVSGSVSGLVGRFVGALWGGWVCLDVFECVC